MFFMQPLLGTFWFAVVYPTSGRKQGKGEIHMKKSKRRGGRQQERKKRREQFLHSTHLR